jgi:hypothetical protein
MLAAPIAEKVELPAELIPNPFQMGKPTNPLPQSSHSLPAQGQTEPTIAGNVPSLLMPLVAFNQALHIALGKLGLAGRIIRSGFGKNLLALAGLGLLAFTFVKIAQLLGWVTHSTNLPWPT